MVATSKGVITANSTLNYTLDLGENNSGENIVFQLKFPKGIIERLSSSCGCTSPKLLDNNENIVEVSYNGNRIGKIAQWVKVKVKGLGEFKITLTGNVKKV